MKQQDRYNIVGRPVMDDFENKNRIYWNIRSRAYGALRQKELSGPDKGAWKKFLLERLPSGKDLRILDVGTGPGFLAILMAEAGFEVTALDFSPSMLEKAEENAKREGVSIRFMEGDAMNLPFEEEFDGIISRNLTWNLPDVPKAYESWRKALKKGGVLLNMDSDYGPVDFTVTSKLAKNAHHGVDAELIQTCQDLKDAIRISTHTRPAWDVSWMQTMGFSSCTVEEDIRSLVHLSREWDYDPLPLFCIRAVKDRN